MLRSYGECASLKIYICFDAGEMKLYFLQKRISQSWCENRESFGYKIRVHPMNIKKVSSD